MTKYIALAFFASTETELAARAASGTFWWFIIAAVIIAVAGIVFKLKVEK